MNAVSELLLVLDSKRSVSQHITGRVKMKANYLDPLLPVSERLLTLDSIRGVSQHNGKRAADRGLLFFFFEKKLL